MLPEPGTRLGQEDVNRLRDFVRRVGNGDAFKFYNGARNIPKVPLAEILSFLDSEDPVSPPPDQCQVGEQWEVLSAEAKYLLPFLIALVPYDDIGVNCTRNS